MMEVDEDQHTELVSQLRALFHPDFSKFEMDKRNASVSSNILTVLVITNCCHLIDEFDFFVTLKHNGTHAAKNDDNADNRNTKERIFRKLFDQLFLNVIRSYHGEHYLKRRDDDDIKTDSETDSLFEAQIRTQKKISREDIRCQINKWQDDGKVLHVCLHFRHC